MIFLLEWCSPLSPCLACLVLCTRCMNPGSIHSESSLKEKARKNSGEKGCHAEEVTLD